MTQLFSIVAFIIYNIPKSRKPMSSQQIQSYHKEYIEMDLLGRGNYGTLFP